LVAVAPVEPARFEAVGAASVEDGAEFSVVGYLLVVDAGDEGQGVVV
jgi:hypothetical protein